MNANKNPYTMENLYQSLKNLKAYEAFKKDLEAEFDTIPNADPAAFNLAFEITSLDLDIITTQQTIDIHLT